jgi:hypothetical protein
VRIPLEIHGVLGSLEQRHDPASNLRSIEALQEWLREAEAYCRSQLERGASTGGKSGRIHSHPEGKNSRGLTDSEFDGKSNATLQTWLTWWSDPARSPHGSEEAGRDPRVEAARVRAELEARDAQLPTPSPQS